MLKVGVFGTGHLGKFHLNNWKLIREAEVVGFYDPNDQTAAGSYLKNTRSKDLRIPVNLLDIAMQLISLPPHLFISIFVKWRFERENMFLLKNHWPMTWKKQELC